MENEGERGTVIYLDANASTATSRVAVEAVAMALSEGPLNPSSAHSSGARARVLLERSRETVAKALGDVDYDNVYFTSGGTEANNIVIGGFSKLARSHVACSVAEHASVLGPIRSCSAYSVVGIRQTGIIQVDELICEIKSARSKGAAHVLASLQAANSETGVIQPLTEQIEALRSTFPEIFIMVDGAQALGRVPLSLQGVDALTFSGHKLHAPAGTGFLYLSDRLAETLPAFAIGGGQEGGVRPGTQNVAGVVGMSAAIEDRMLNLDEHVARLAVLRARLEAGVLSSVPGTRVVGAESPRTPNTSNLFFSGLDAQALLARLDEAGVLCSTGSACSSARPEASPVLKAMGMTDREASSCLRFSVSVMNTESEINDAVEVIARCAERGIRTRE